MGAHKRVLVIVFCLLLFGLLGCQQATNYPKEKSVSQEGKNQAVLNQMKKDAEHFPVDADGYPQKGQVLVNGKTYSLKNFNKNHVKGEVDCRIDLTVEKNNNIVEVILSKYLPIYRWEVKEQDGQKVELSEIVPLSIDKDKQLEGPSNELQLFAIQLSGDQPADLIFQCYNVNEEDKGFEDRQETYLLQLHISQ